MALTQQVEEMSLATDCFFKKVWRANESICISVTVSDFGLNAACELMDNGNDFWRPNPASMFVVGQI